ncbi:MAG TPA: hypothetical protein VKF80_10660 [Candidatus Eisenbacteria bacterium]|nr:hypothetical protein [Candidatus Eisenbacteria bacterium]
MLALLALGVRGSWASEEVPYDVAQPIQTDGGIYIVHVAYTSNNGTCCPAVVSTCRPNAVMTDSGAQNRNAAYLAGITVTATSKAPSDLPDWMCDTLDVQMDLSRIQSHEREFGEEGLRDLVAKTVACLRENAWRCGGHLRILRLHITGAPWFRKLEGTFPITEYRAQWVHE